MSTVSSTSAGLLAPSVLMRCSRPELGRDHIDLDAGVLGEGIEQRLDQLRLAIGVDIDFAGLRESALSDEGGGKIDEGETRGCAYNA